MSTSSKKCTPVLTMITVLTANSLLITIMRTACSDILGLLGSCDRAAAHLESAPNPSSHRQDDLQSVSLRYHHCNLPSVDNDVIVEMLARLSILWERKGTSSKANPLQVPLVRYTPDSFSYQVRAIPFSSGHF